MSSKSPLPWDLEHSMTTFQVNPNWYEEYWLRDTKVLTGQHVHHRPDGSIDFDFYRGCAKHERDFAIKQAYVALSAMLVRFFSLQGRRLTSTRRPLFQSMYQRLSHPGGQASISKPRVLEL
jgi:hypothetical protein